MKKYFLLLLICLLLVPSGVVCAASVTDSGDSSSYWIDHGIISYKTDGTFYGKEDSTCLTSFSISIDSSDEENPCLFFVKTVNDGFYKYTLYGRGSTYSQQRTDTYYGCGSDGMDIVDSRTPDILELYSYPNSSAHSIGYFDTSYGFSCSIPIFSGTDEEVATYVKNYLDNGDVSGADNVDDLPFDLDVDDSIELPQNFKVVSGHKYTFTNNLLLTKLSKDIVLTWNQTVDTSNYLYDVEYSYTYSVYVDGEYVDVTIPYVSYSEKNKYSGSKNITYTLKASDIQSAACSHYLTTDYNNIPGNISRKDDHLLPNIIKIRVRNRMDKLCSNYVLITIDFKNKTATTSEVDSDDNTVDDAEYDNTDGTTSNEDFDNSDGGNNISLSGIMSYIKSGFGLLGNGGILSLISGLFSYVPASVWVLIKCAIAISISIMVLSLVKRFVFG